MAKKIPSWHEDTTLFDPAARVEGLQGAATELHIAVEGLSSETALWLWVDTFGKFLQTDQDDPSEDFAHYAE